MENIPDRILWLLGRVADQRSRLIALHLNLEEWPVYAALQQLEQEGKVQRVTVRRKLETITVYRLNPVRSTVATHHQPSPENITPCRPQPSESLDRLLVSSHVTGGL